MNPDLIHWLRTLVVCSAVGAILTACVSTDGTDRRADTEVSAQYCQQVFAQPFVISDKKQLLDRVAENSAKDEFETTEEYRSRLRKSLLETGGQYPSAVFVKWNLDPQYIRYDADTQTLTIKEYAVSNLSPESETLFGRDSLLARRGINNEYTVLTDDLVLTFEHQEEVTGSFVGQNAFGATTRIQKLSHHVSGVFERPGRHGESVWSIDKISDRNPGDLGINAFVISAPPDLARQLLENAVVVLSMKLKYPYYAEGEKHYEARITNPYQHSYFYQYLIADMQCMALAGSGDEIISTRTLH